MNKTTHALATFATVALLGGVAVAQQPQASGPSGQTLPRDEMMKQCIEHCRAAAAQSGNQTDDKQPMGCMAMMGMQNMKGTPEVKNGSGMQDMPAMRDMPGMASGMQGNSAPAATQHNPRMATSVRELERACGQKVDPRTAPKSTFNRKTYYFCTPEDKTRFDQSPAEVVDERSRWEPREEAAPHAVGAADGLGARID